MGCLQQGSAWVRIALVLLVAIGAAVPHAFAGEPDQKRVQQGWTMIERHSQKVLEMPAISRPHTGQAATLDIDAMRTMLAVAPLEGTPEALTRPIVMFLPTPGGSWQRFNVVESPLMEKAFQVAHPDLKTYSGQGVDDPWATLRFEMTGRGFSAQVLSPDGPWYIDPVSRGDLTSYTSYFKVDYSKEREVFNCGVLNQNVPGVPRFRPRGSLGPMLRSYRIAISCTGEFTLWAGGANEALNVVVTAVSRLSGIYEQELSVRFLLIGSESDLIYSDRMTDPFSAPDNAGISLDENQISTDAVIGAGAYDIGHVFHVPMVSNDNGRAQVACVCTASKARGYTAYSNPNSVFFVVDYVSHEVGHQFGGRHPHANCNGNPGDANEVLVEPASGSTIMAYPGICGPTNLQMHADPYFNALNFDQMLPVVLGSTCALSVPTGNGVPSVSAGPLHNIPAKTPFTLTAVGSDPDGNALTFCWEEGDAGPGIDLPLDQHDNGISAIVRSRPPKVSPSRTVPDPVDLAANRFPLGETTPQVARSMRWRVTIRDNVAGGAAVNSGETTLTVIDTGAPFEVTAPNTNGSFSGQLNVTWDVANTNASPINCANVRISLSTDSGLTFPTILAPSVPNNGSTQVALPNLNTTTARIKVEAVDNIFFDISNADFSIVPSGPIAVFAASPSPSVDDHFGNGNGNLAIDPGEGGLRITVPITNIGTLNATNVRGDLFSLSPTVTVLVSSRPYPNISVGQIASNTFPFEISVDPSHPCGLPIQLVLAVTSTEGANNISFTMPVGSASMGVPRTFRFPPNMTDPPLALVVPDNTAAGLNVEIPIADVGSIGDVNFRFDGTSCSTQIGAAGVGLAHSYVGDMVVRLFNPQGTGVSIMNRPGVLGGNPTSGSSGNNFCNTIFDDDGNFPSIQAIAADGTGAPYTGTYRPAQPLSLMDGQNGDGMWVLNLSDRSAGDVGILRRYALVITPQNSICSPPLSVTGACCSAAGVCVVAAPGFCPAGSVYQGNASACSPNPCPQPMGACCATDGTCSVLTGQACSDAGSTYQGDATLCNPNPCPQPSGPCCLNTGACFLNTQVGCAGNFLGSGTSCVPINPCQQPMGECCDVSSGACSVTLSSACSGIWTSFGTCTPNPCAQPTGSCCTLTGQCSIARQAQCTGTWSEGGVCTPNPCVQPTASCCINGVCTVTTQSGCSGIWGGAASCTPNPCPQPTAACCVGNGCAISTQAACTGTWGPATMCIPNPCGAPVMYTLALNQVAGTGGGHVTSFPTGISCPGTCSALYASSTSVTLTATPSGNTRFGGWSGACSGFGPCNVIMSQARNVGFRFICRADLNGNNMFEVEEIFDYLNLWFQSDPAADMGVTPGTVDVPDLLEFLNLWFTGCAPSP